MTGCKKDRKTHNIKPTPKKNLHITINFAKGERARRGGGGGGGGGGRGGGKGG